MNGPEASASNVIIYSSPFCGYCAAAKRLLKKKDVGFTEINVLFDPKRRQKMVQLTGRHTVPQIFIGGQSIGGYDELSALEAEGGLDSLLAQQA